MFNKIVGGPGSYDQYCFSAKLVRLVSRTHRQLSFKAAVNKGLVAMDQTKQTYTMDGTVCEPQGALVNFNLPNYSPKRPVEFILQISDLTNDQVLGRVSIPSSDFVEQYKASQKNFFESSVQLGDGLILDYIIFIERSRIALMNSIKQIQSQKSIQKQVDSPVEVIRAAETPSKRTFSRRTESSVSMPTQQVSTKFAQSVSKQDDQKSIASEIPTLSKRQSPKKFIAAKEISPESVEPTRTHNVVDTPNKMLQSSKVRAAVQDNDEVSIPQQTITVSKNRVIKSTISQVVQPLSKKTQSIMLESKSKKSTQKEEKQLNKPDDVVVSKKTKLGALVVLVVIFFLFFAPKIFRGSHKYKKEKRSKKHDL